MTISWDPARMATGVPAVDIEHQEWIHRFQEFDIAISTGHGLDSVQKILDYMVEYTERHFVHEELLAGEAETPAIRLNRAEHNDFRKKISDMRTWVDQNGVSAVEVVSLKMDLEAWLLHHICCVDARIWTSS